MWSNCLPLLLAAFTASSLAAPSPLTASASTVTTLSGLGSGDNHDAILIHVLRTADLIADEVPSKPLLLERLSHLLIRVELGNQSVGVNGHHLPILPGSHRPLEMSVQLEQVQMLKMPKGSPLIPLRLSAHELTQLADKYMTQGIVGAMFRVTQEPLDVQARRADNTPVAAEAYKVTFSIKILEVDGLSLAQTNLPPIDLLHLIAHPDAQDPTKVATLTTLAPEALTDPSPASQQADMLGSALDLTRASILATFAALGNAIQGMAAHTSSLLHGHRLRRPCHKSPHHHHHKQATKPVALAHATAAAPKHTAEKTHGRTSIVDSFRHGMKCISKMNPRSSLVILLLGLPLAIILMVATSSLSNAARRRMQAASEDDVPPTYKAVPLDEKMSDEEAVLLMTALDTVKS